MLYITSSSTRRFFKKPFGGGGKHDYDRLHFIFVKKFVSGQFFIFILAHHTGAPSFSTYVGTPASEEPI